MPTDIHGAVIPAITLAMFIAILFMVRKFKRTTKPQAVSVRQVPAVIVDSDIGVRPHGGQQDEQTQSVPAGWGVGENHPHKKSTT